MRRFHTVLLALALPFAACGGDAEVDTTDEVASGDESLEVDDPAGTQRTHDPEHPEAYDRLADDLTDMDQRVDHGDYFARDEIADGLQGRRMVLRGAVLETWEFDTDAEARAFAGRFSPDGRLFDGERLPWQESTNLWIYGPVVVMYVGSEGHAIAAMDEVAERVGAPIEDQVTSPDEVEALVRSQIANRIGLDPASLQLVTREQVTFDDACLEVPDAAETCDDIETPGWRFVFRAEGDEVTAHADSGGARVFFPNADI